MSGQQAVVTVGTPADGDFCGGTLGARARLNLSKAAIRPGSGCHRCYAVRTTHALLGF